MSREEVARPVVSRARPWREAVSVLAAAFLFNLGQGVLRPSLPLYLRDVFGASYRMVTLIPVVFGAGKWIAGVPTGYLLDRVGRVPLMMAGLFVIAACDIASVMASRWGDFLGARGMAGAGWAMFATVATTAVIQRQARGRGISLLLMSESVGLLIGSAGGGWLYEGAGRTSPFIVEASCMLLAAGVVGVLRLPRSTSSAAPRASRISLRAILAMPAVRVAFVSNAVLMSIQTGVLAFLFPLYLAERGHFGAHAIGALVAATVLGRIVALWLGGSLSDRHDRVRLLAFGLGAFGAVLGTLPLITGRWMLAVWSLLVGAGGGFVASVPTAIVGDRVGASMHGVAIGWLRGVTDVGMLIGPLVMGPLADAFGLEASFVLAATILGALTWACGHTARVTR